MSRFHRANSRQPTADSHPHDPRGCLLQQLRRQLEQGAANDQIRMTNDERRHSGHSSFVIRHSSLPYPPFSSGTAAIDRLLPGGGLRYGMLVEWVEENDEARMTNDERKHSSSFVIRHSSFTLSLLAAREACRAGGVLVVIDRARTFYPPAAANWRINPDRLIVVRPASARDELWAAVQSLRSPAVAAVWMPMDRLDDRAFRRLQLAAQAGRTLGLLVRPPRARDEPSWADVRLEVGESRVKSPESRARIPALDSGLSALDFRRRVRVRVVRCRHGRAGGTAWLEIDDAAHAIGEVEQRPQQSAAPFSPNRVANSS